MRKRFKKQEKSEFDQKIIDVARVVRIVAGGRRFRFRVTAVVGNRKGKIGMGIGKASDVTSAITKAVSQAKKNLVTVPIVDGTIPHEIKYKHDGANIFMKPARPGTGIIAGGPIRAVIELSGIKDLVSKMQGSSNKPNNVIATIEALKSLSTAEAIAKSRGVEIMKKKSSEDDKTSNAPSKKDKGNK